MGMKSGGGRMGTFLPKWLQFTSELSHTSTPGIMNESNHGIPESWMGFMWDCHQSSADQCWYCSLTITYVGRMVKMNLNPKFHPSKPKHKKWCNNHSKFVDPYSMCTKRSPTDRNERILQGFLLEFLPETDGIYRLPVCKLYRHFPNVGYRRRTCIMVKIVTIKFFTGPFRNFFCGGSHLDCWISQWGQSSRLKVVGNQTICVLC